MEAFINLQKTMPFMKKLKELWKRYKNKQDLKIIRKMTSSAITPKKIKILIDVLNRLGKMLNSIEQKRSWESKIESIHPELDDKRIPLPERIKIYYEIKSIKSQRLHNWLIVILTLLLVTFTAVDIYLKLRG